MFKKQLFSVVGLSWFKILCGIFRFIPRKRPQSFFPSVAVWIIYVCASCRHFVMKTTHYTSSMRKVIFLFTTFNFCSWEKLPLQFAEMDDNARGMASKILCDLLNIGNTGTSDGGCKFTRNFSRSDKVLLLVHTNWKI